MCEARIHIYLDQLAAREPTPGGGSVSALVGALGAGLMEMVSNFTLGKEKFKAIEKDITQILKKAASARQRLMALIEEDKAAYQPVANAYKLPKDTDEEKAKRKEAIHRAMEQAKKIPQEIKQLCEELLKDCDALEQKGNPLLTGDARAAREFLRAAVRGAENFI